jgi:two-component system osmolarity sensor histidine kinase EnvZ
MTPSVSRARGDTTHHNAAEPAPRGGLWWRFNRFLERHLPEGLYKRAMIIVIAPVLLLQAIMTGIFLERHWEQVTKTLSKSLAREISFIVALYDTGPKTPQALARLERLANERLAIGLRIESGVLPPPRPRPWFSILHYRLSRYIARYVPGRPFWLDTIGQSGYVDIRIQVDEGRIFRFLTPQGRAYASSTHIFLLWMAGVSLVLLIVAVIFLHKQIKPILRLAEAAQAFGKGREVPDFEPRGAAEIRAAARAFINMKRRIERHVEQRTAMLAGVSHDLRTILTRFRLELSMLEGDEQTLRAMREDVEEMQRMLEGYLAFVRGAESEQTVETEICTLLRQVAEDLRHGERHVEIDCPAPLMVAVRPGALRRALANLAGNAVRHAKSRVRLSARRDENYLHVLIEDDGPGIPPGERQRVFRPFVRLDAARNTDEAGTGLGLAIALDIVQSHGGDIELKDSEDLRGLKALVRIPL